MELLTNVKFTAFTPAADINGAGLDSRWVQLRDYGRVMFGIVCTSQAGTPAVTLEQAENNAGLNAASFPLRERRRIADTADATPANRDLYVRTAVTGDTFNLTAGNNQVYLVDADAQDLTDPNDFVRLRIANPGGASIVGVFAVAYEARDKQRLMPTAMA